jgi:hypothetical protein
LAGEQIQRVASQEEVMSSVRSLQQSSVVCSKLSRGSVAGYGEVFLDLFRPGETTPRYTVHVLDQPYAKETGRRFAAFIVPQGRQVFSLPKQFLTMEAKLQDSILDHINFCIKCKLKFLLTAYRD